MGTMTTATTTTKTKTRQITPFRALILFLRCTTAIFGLAALVLFVLVLENLSQSYVLWNGVNLLSLFSAVGLLLWNLSTFIIMISFERRVPQILLIYGDVIIFSAALGLGVAGSFYDIVNYSGSGFEWFAYGGYSGAVSTSLLVLGVVVLFLGLSGQTFTLLFNILEHKHIKETERKKLCDQYTGYPGAVISRDDFGEDWKSEMSVETTDGSASGSGTLIYEGSSEASSEVRRPTLAVEPKTRFNFLKERGGVVGIFEV